MAKYSETFDKGYCAFEAGHHENANPYQLGSPDFIVWSDGWHSAKSANSDIKPTMPNNPAEQINALAVSIYADNVAKGFWPQNAQDRNVGEALMLAVSELSEGLEAHRKGLNDDHLPHRKGLEVEIVDCIIRLLDLSGGLGLDVGGALVEKLAYNRNRPHKHGKNY